MPMSMFVVALFAIVGIAFAANMLVCDPPSKVFGPHRLNVAFHGTTLEQVCEHQSPPLNDTKMTNYCQAFCAAGQPPTLSLLLGTSHYGFNLDEMTTVCSSVTEYNRSREEFCRGRSNALAEIEAKAAQFVGHVEVFKEQQTAFRASTRKLARDLRAELVSERFRHEVDHASDKIGVLKTKFQFFKAQLVHQGGAIDALLAAMQRLEASATQLQSAVNSHLPLVEEFFTECNRILLGTGSQHEFLLDICSQTGSDCVEAEGSSHVGCCCGVNPVLSLPTLRTLRIDGISSGLFGDQGYVGLRRLQGTEIDVCAESRVGNSNDIRLVREQIEQSGFAELLAEEDQAKQAKYPGYFNQCARGRRLTKDDTYFPTDVMGAVREEPLHQLRGLQAMLQCSPPPSHDGTGLKPALSDTVEKDVCHLQQPPLQNAEMQAQCDLFCQGSGAVPLQMGTQSYGFNLSEAEAICLPPSGVLVHNPEKLRQCHQWSSSSTFNLMEEKSADVIAQLSLFKTQRLFYAAELENVTLDLQRYITSDEFVGIMARARDKVGTLVDAVNNRLVSGASLAKTKMQDAMRLLAVKADSLARTLGTQMALLGQYLSECNELFVGSGLQDEYLLDVCAQRNDACIHESNAGHVSCCCAYHPFSTFGQPTPQATISGLDNFGPQARAAAGDRRLMDEFRRLTDDSNTAMDICAQAWTKAVGPVSKVLACAEKTGQARMVRENMEAMIARYGDDYCGFEADIDISSSECDTVPVDVETTTSTITTSITTSTTTTTPTANPTGAPDTSGQPASTTGRSVESTTAEQPSTTTTTVTQGTTAQASGMAPPAPTMLLLLLALWRTHPGADA